MRWERRRDVRAPDLRLWRIGQRWWLWRPRMREVRLSGDNAWNLGSFFDDLSTGLAATILVFVLVVLTSPLAGIGVFFAEWMLVLLLVPLGVAYRWAFRRPWFVYAETADGRDHLVASVVGWQESQQVIEQAAVDVQHAGTPQSGRWTRVDGVDI